MDNFLMLIPLTFLGLALAGMIFCYRGMSRQKYDIYRYCFLGFGLFMLDQLLGLVNYAVTYFGIMTFLIAYIHYFGILLRAGALIVIVVGFYKGSTDKSFQSKD